MKKLLVILSLATTVSFAMTSVNLQNNKYHCQGIAINSQISVNQLMANCKNPKLIIHEDAAGGRNASRIPGGGAAITEDDSNTDDVSLDKVEFYTNSNSYMICYFKNSALIKCKVNPSLKTTQPPSTAVASAPTAMKSLPH